MTVSDILTQFRISSDTDAAENLPAPDGTMQSAAHPILVLESVMLALEEPFLRIQTIAEAAVAKLNAFIPTLEPSTSRIEAWLAAAERHRVSAGEITTAIERIQTAAEQIREGSGNKRPWEQLGISPDQDPLDVLDQMHACARTFAPAIVRPILADVGMGDDMFHLLRQQELGFLRIAEKDNPGSSTRFFDSVSDLVQSLMASSQSAVMRASRILSGFRDTLFDIADFAAERDADISALAPLAWPGNIFREIADPVGNAAQQATALMDYAGEENMGRWMQWLTLATTPAVPSAIPQLFSTQPSSTLTLSAVSNEPVDSRPNTTVTVNQYIEGSSNPQKAAEDAIRRMLEQTAAQIPAQSY